MNNSCSFNTLPYYSLGNLFHSFYEVSLQEILIFSYYHAIKFIYNLLPISYEVSFEKCCCFPTLSLLEPWQSHSSFSSYPNFTLLESWLSLSSFLWAFFDQIMFFSYAYTITVLAISFVFPMRFVDQLWFFYYSYAIRVLAIYFIIIMKFLWTNYC